MMHVGSKGVGLEALRPMANLSKTQIDRLGERLKTGVHSEADLQLLDEYRRSFGSAYEEVLRVVRSHNLSPSGRRAKSTSAIVEKLQRESIRLSQMQDIAGCRIVVSNVVDQDKVVAALRAAFPAANVTDRRARPSFGYRAVHIIVEAAGRPIEIQVRSVFQHLWAERSERCADVVDSAIKYGGGPADLRMMLDKASRFVGDYESLEESTMAQLMGYLREMVNANPNLEDDSVPKQETKFEAAPLERGGAIDEELLRLFNQRNDDQKKTQVDRWNTLADARALFLREKLGEMVDALNDLVSTISELERKKK